MEDSAGVVKTTAGVKYEPRTNVCAADKFAEAAQISSQEPGKHSFELP
jgi:hypothetical protein